MSVLLFIALATVGAPDAQTTPPAPAAKPVKEKKICRSEVPTGSMMPMHTCHTKEQWEQIDGANAASAEQMRNRSAAPGAMH